MKQKVNPMQNLYINILSTSEINPKNPGAVEKAQHTKCLPHKPRDLSLIPRTHLTVEGENWFHKTFSDPYTYNNNKQKSCTSC